MSIKPLLTIDNKEENEILRTVSVCCDGGDKSLKCIIQDMKDTYAPTHGAGIAAPQIGSNKRIITIGGDSPNFKSLSIPKLTLLNPIYEAVGTQKIIIWEHCLSIPNRRGKTVRYNKINYKGKTPEGELIDSEAEGVLAILLQHEIDHLDGILFVDHLESADDFGSIEEMENKYGKDHHKEFVFVSDKENP